MFSYDFLLMVGGSRIGRSHIEVSISDGLPLCTPRGGLGKGGSRYVEGSNGGMGKNRFDDCWSFFGLSFWKHVSKLWGIILIDFGLITFRFYYVRDQRPSCS